MSCIDRSVRACMRCWICSQNTSKRCTSCGMPRNVAGGAGRSAAGASSASTGASGGTGSHKLGWGVGRAVSLQMLSPSSGSACSRSVKRRRHESRFVLCSCAIVYQMCDGGGVVDGGRLARTWAARRARAASSWRWRSSGASLSASRDAYAARRLIIAMTSCLTLTLGCS